MRIASTFLIVYVIVFFGNTTAVQAQVACSSKDTRINTIDCYKNLWIGGETPSDDDIKTGKASGIVNNGPLSATSISTTITLSINSTMWRSWDMVLGRFCPIFGGDTDCPTASVNPHLYFKLYYDSFLIHIYQTSDDTFAGTVTKDKLIYPDIRNFPASDADLSTIQSGKPLNYIFKFSKDAAAFSKFWDNFFSSSGNKFDGYSTDPGSTLLLGVGDISGPALVNKQTAIIKIDTSGLDPDKKTFMDLWYLGSGLTTTSDPIILPPGAPDKIPPKDQPAGSRVRYFDNRWKDNNMPYFQIGKTAEFKIASKINDTDILNTQQNASSTNSHLETTEGILPNCAIVGDGGTFLGCVAQFFYYAIFTPIQWFAGIMGKVFDFFLGFSLDDQSYRADFIVTAWKVIRDFSNIFFIIILIYTGLAAVFDIGKVSMKHIVPQLIINALVINFSLFVTRIAIDASNIFARVFYNQINACQGECKRDDKGIITNAAPTIGGYKQISPTLVSIFDPQVIFSSKSISLDSLPSGVKSASALDNQAVSSTNYFNIEANRNKNSYAAYFIILSIVAALIMFAAAIMFWKTSFFFLGRVIGLFMVMIFSPFAFLTREMPLIGSIKRLRWDDWVSELTNYALLAPIFVFFLLIIYSLAASPFITNMKNTVGQGGDILPTILSIVLPMLIMYFMIKQGVDIAKSYAGFVGGKVQEFIGGIANKTAGFATGAAIGIASGGLGIAGRGVGMVAKNIQTKTKLGDLLNRTQTKGNLGGWKDNLGGWVARRSNNILAKTQKASFDPRNSKIFSSQLNSLGKKFGMQVKTNNAVLGALRLNSDQTKGGLKGYEKRKDKEVKEVLERVETHYKTDKEATTFYEKLLQKEHSEEIAEINKLKNNDSLLEKVAKRQLDEKVKEEAKKGNTFSYSTADVKAKAVENKSKLQKQADELTFENFKEKQEKQFGKVKDNKTLTQAMRLKYAMALKEDPTTTWDTIRMGINPLMIGDELVHDRVKKDALEKYIKDTQKNFKSTEKSAKELESIDKTLTELLKEMHQKNPAAGYDAFKNDKGDFDSKTMGDDDRNEMLKRRRADLDTELEMQEQRLDELKQKMRNPRNSQTDTKQKEYDEAINRGDTAGAERAEQELNRLKEEIRDRLKPDYQSAAKAKGETKEEIEDLKNILRRRNQAEQKVNGTKKEDKKGDKEDKGKGGDDKEDKK